MKNPYLKLAVSSFISFLVMYGVMFLNVVQFDHIYLSYTRTYMAFLMVMPMVILKLAFMWGMFPKPKLNWGIMGGAAFVFFLCLWGLRSQTPIGDVQYMKAMIPHHSSAILTSQRAHIEDPEVRKLADDIIQAQVKEIAMMKEYLARLNP